MVNRLTVWRNRPSTSAFLLARRMGGQVNKLNSTRTPSVHTDVINWGCSQLPWFHEYHRLLNVPEAVYDCVFKDMFLQAMAVNDIPHPEVLTPQEAHSRLLRGKRVCARTHLAGHSGQGLHVLSEPPQGWDPECTYVLHGNVVKLWTRYIPKKAEYRVHLVDDCETGECTAFVQQKKKRRGAEVNHEVRSHDNGWVYTVQNVDAPEAVLTVARRAMYVMGLDFGAVDVIFNEQSGNAYVLEINTAPGLFGESTLNFYAENLSKLVQQWRGE